MTNAGEKKKKEYPKRRRARIKFETDRECITLPVEISCRADGECVIRHPRMEELIFPKVVEKGKESKKEVK